MRWVNAGLIDQSHSLATPMNIPIYKVHGMTLGGADVLQLLTCINLTAALSLEQQLRQEEKYTANKFAVLDREMVSIKTT